MGNFEFDGQKYKAASGLQKEWGTRIIAELSITGSETILDLGCGDGILTKKLANLVPEGKVLGIDASKGMIETAKELEGYNLSFAVQDINDLPFSNEFDLIFSNAALHWVKNHEMLLHNCYRALKSGGVIRFNFAGDGNCSNFYEIVHEVMNYPSYRTDFNDFVWPWFMPRIREYEKLLNHQEFKELRCWEENADRNFKTKDDMVKWIDQPSIVPFLEFLPKEKQSGFRDEVVNRMVDKTIQPDGTCFETFRRINVFARK
ncbi:MAG: methyltransferase domain-containing protein [Desulfotomaculaceae bacterium]|nr:methyltransferase domain-containing protein [Desulfotomaculaceae bacterium]